MPAHCEIFGILGEHHGVDGQDYAIRFHLRLPDDWNGRFLFQGGGGTNGEIGNATGPVSRGTPSALQRGYAVVSQDSGHDNRRNGNPLRGGATAFGFDPQARADYGHASLAPVARAARAIILAYYRTAPAFSYFVGCSKGGEEGMVLAQKHPTLFDGIVAAAPGFALPRAAVAQVWDVQAMAKATGSDVPTLAALAKVFSDADLALAGKAVLAACDADDGLIDGIVAAIGSCTDDRVRGVLDRTVCIGDKTQACLSSTQLAVLARVMGGARKPDGTLVYARWPWDPGIASPGWRLWKLGSADGKIPALNVVLGGASLPSVFSVPPTPVPADPSALLAWEMRYDFATDVDRIYATGGAFARSGWQDVSARSPDLAAFRAHGGKMVVPHGVADPVFSIDDTIDWYRQVDARSGGDAAGFVRLFPVPGMNHCGGGPATDEYDALAALVDWVERKHAPDAIIATAGPNTPWPGRTRPLCPFPKTARYVGGDKEKASAFICS
ncbi:tannase/feruloyl esterase family alpha/beta hydrolase [Sphingomonas sp. BIUV-7]|uniref:Tannase/feruloyl esterase family alpha/beta hydrolase n=1 Tax=Sphingomonas natans TaxID=3063330 RepID=A0ABT8Y8S4_9SPHN|nr:tannase/feruloyl esterase family alpha/beta hydrolase [Sphingomonas sp. BIUV-7]MDO6414724.1 tannase/feruloyl esterase family alpha/beta hydrolase [Sphingomonas sp. BIUV-7]